MYYSTLNEPLEQSISYSMFVFPHYSLKIVKSNKANISGGFFYRSENDRNKPGKKISIQEKRSQKQKKKTRVNL